ncbi:P27 family phage terminase small subunit [Bacillus pacificus]|uniref:P27 family phage terminase small subunit n=1 Tax=Bacillus pacificus TaxID=2026187 RepID=UPI00397C07B1
MVIKKKKYELAFEDYKNGMTYADIATKYGVAETTVRDTWRKRHWKEALEEHTNLRDTIRDNLIGQMRSNGVTHTYFLDMVDDYMSFWDVKNSLIADINERGVSVLGANGFLKKNDSINELNKTNNQMLKILNELGLKAVSEDDDDEAEV